MIKLLKLFKANAFVLRIIRFTLIASLIVTCLLSFNSGATDSDVFGGLKPYYIKAVEVEAQVTTIPKKKGKLLLSLVSDGSKFWIIDKDELGSEKEDFERMFIVLDESLSNIIRGEQYKLNDEYYNLLDKNINTDNLTEVNYSTYKALELECINNLNSEGILRRARMQCILLASLCLFYLICVRLKDLLNRDLNSEKTDKDN